MQDLSQSQKMEQRQTLSQQQTQSLQLLAYTNLELKAFLQQEQLENPLLELHEPVNDAEALISLSKWMRDEDYTWREGVNLEAEPPSDIPQSDTNGLKNYLRSQINDRSFNKTELRVIEYIFDSLNEAGYLPMSVQEISFLTKCSVAEAKHCIDEVRQLEPCGIGADSLSQCLVLQAQALGYHDPNLLEMIKYHLADIAASHFGLIAKELSISTDQVKKLVAVIRTLNPRPASAFSESPAPYVVPDVLFKKENSVWQIELNDHWIGSIGISKLYVNLAKKVDDPSVTGYFAEKLNRAKLITQFVEQRRTTLLRVSRAILDAQLGFFEQNDSLLPLTLKDIAEQLAVHESTVSRAVKGKYLQCPGGIFPMRHFFSASVGQKAGISRSHVKKLISSLIEAENARKPLSDSKLTELLQEQGIVFSRRAVAKYREELGIKSTYERKQ